MFERSFIIENSYENQINLILFDLNSGVESNLILNAGEQYRGSTFETSVRVDDIPNESGASISLNAGKIIIIFDNDRILVSELADIDNGQGFFSEPIQFNLLRNGNYQNIGNDQYLYKISQADYNAATPCDGPCE